MIASMGKILGLIYDSGVPLSSICISMAVLSLGWFKIFKADLDRTYPT